MTDFTKVALAAYAENIAVICCATFLAYQWDSAWPFLLLVLCNSVTSRKGRT